MSNISEEAAKKKVNPFAKMDDKDKDGKKDGKDMKGAKSSGKSMKKGKC